MAGMVRIFSLTSLILIVSVINVNALVFTGNIQNSPELKGDTNLKELLSSTAPETNYVLLIGSDGTAALITERSIHEIDLVKQDSTWNSVTQNLPPVCNIRNLKEICIYTRTNGMNKFSKRLNNFEFIGQSSKNGHFVRKYKEKIGDYF